MMEESTASFVGTVTSFFLKCGSVLIGVTSIALGLLYYKQDSLLYFPEIGGVAKRTRSNPRGYRSPSEYNIPYESHLVNTSDGASIHCWLLLHPSSGEGATALKSTQKPTILFFHGNAGNIGLRLPNAAQMYHTLQANIALVEYRGFGDSSDHSPSEAGLKLDAEAALRFIQSYWSEKAMVSNIFIFGRSLGGAVGFHLAQYAERNNIAVCGVMVENTFLSIDKMVDVVMPLVAPFKALILRIHWNSESIAASIRVPVLYLAGAKDQLVPHKHMTALYQLSKTSANSNPKSQMHVISSGTHNDSWLQGGTLYWEQMKVFMENCKLDHAFHTKNASMNSLSTSKSSLEEWVDGSSVETVGVSMGIALDSSNNRVASAIPIMPGNLMGMAREVSAAAMSQTKKAKEM